MKYTVIGAGSIGCYIGGKLANVGFPVTLIGRKNLQSAIRSQGLQLTGTGVESGIHIKPEDITVKTDTASVNDADVILVTVKSKDTKEAAKQINEALSAVVNPAGQQPVSPLIVSFQNGVRNAGEINEIIKNHSVLAGMVPYNVLRKSDSHFHCGTSGHLMIEKPRTGREKFFDRFLADFKKAGLPIEPSEDLQSVLWGKLVINLNNAVNALAGVPLREQLADRAYRKITAAVMKEALAVLKKAGINPGRAGKMIPKLAPFILGLPDFLFFKVASSMVKIDPEARSSMWEDLSRGRKTEIEYLNGEIVRLAEEHGTGAPLSAMIVELIREAEKNPDEWQPVSAAELSEKMSN